MTEFYSFGRFSLDTRQGVLLRDGSPVPLVPRAVELLAVLLRNSGKVVRKQELIESLWPDVMVEEGNLAKLVFLLRKEIGEELIQTLPKRGYRFAGELLPAAPPPGQEIVAVLPFVDLSESRDQSSFCEGVSEEILNAVARVPGVKVVGRTSSFKLAGTSLDVREIGARLSATALVEGSIRKAGPTLRLTARLIDARTALHRWSAAFDQNSSDIFSVQAEVAQAVARNLLPGTTAAPAAPQVVDLETYELYLQGRYYWNRRPGDVVWKALRCFEQAIERDPRFAAAWAGIADIQATLGSWEAGVLEPGEAEVRAQNSATRALELDPKLADAHTTLAYTALHYRWSPSEAESRFRHALSLNPNYAAAHHWYSHCLAAAGRFEESLAESRTALAVDPMNLLLSVHLAWHHHMAREPELVLQQSERVVHMDAQYHWGHYFAGWGAEALGEHARSVDSMRAAVRCSGDDPVMIAGLARAQAAAGDHADARATLARLEERRAGRALFGYEAALVHLALGERAKALDLLERARTEKSGWMPYLRVDPRLDPLRGEPRFASLLGAVASVSP